MKKYIVLFGVVVSGLAHAAEEPSKPKKINCADLARHIKRKNESEFGVRDGEKGIIEKGAVHIRLMYNSQDGSPEKEKNSFPCNEVPTEYMFIRPWERQAFEQGEDLAAQAKEGVLALEHCVQESPEYVDSPQVKETLASLKQKADLWPQCLQAQREAVAAQQEQEEKERGMDEYVLQRRAQHKSGAQHDPNPPRKSIFDRWFQG